MLSGDGIALAVVGLWVEFEQLHARHSLDNRHIDDARDTWGQRAPLIAK